MDALWEEDGEYYTAIIEKVTGSEFSVRFTEYDVVVTVTEDQMTSLEPDSPKKSPKKKKKKSRWWWSW